ncbi:class II fructose-bisphosphate aldolase [Peribacillus sp. NPDC096540]|uniref:class II fructose-bisphosphate aldolase n=1 Tax=Peribacillus sp. NPDC096540 TaxID=3390612 RepID=UPI003D0778FB
MILALAERYLDYINIEIFAEIVKIRSAKSQVPVCLHLDHAYNLKSITAAINSGFSSVMYDGSQLPFEENVRQTKKIVELAHKAGVSVEAELGSIARGEYSDEEDGDHVLTDPKLAKYFVEQTNIDFLAPAIGTFHGMYKEDPVIDLKRLDEIHTS